MVASHILLVLDKHDKLAQLTTLNEIFIDISKVLDDLSVTFGFQTMLGTGLAFFYTFFSLFITSKVWIFNQVEFRNEAICCAIWWIFCNFYPQMLIAGNELLKHDTKIIMKHLNEIIKRSRSRLTVLTAIAFSNCIQGHPIIFTCGLFDFDLKFAFTVSKLNLFYENSYRTFLFTGTRWLSFKLPHTSSIRCCFIQQRQNLFR